jgi:hypothetical protein
MRSISLVAALGMVMLAGCASTSGSGEQGEGPSATAAKPARTAAQIPMEELMDNPKANAVLVKHAPSLAANPQLSMARGMTLADVAGYAEAGLSPELVAAIVADVNKL